MTGVIEIDTSELDDVIERLESALSDTEMRQCLLDCGHVIESSAVQKAPIDVGNLRRSILTREGTGDDSSTLSVTIGVHEDTAVSSGCEYAPYIEYGTGIYAENGNGRKTPWRYQGKGGKYAGWHTTQGMHAQPFMRPAFDENIDECTDIIEEYIDNALGGTA